MSNEHALYYRIYRQLSVEIQTGTFDDAGKLPPETALAERFCVARITIRKALELLAEDGLITRFPKRGSCLTKQRADGDFGCKEAGQTIGLLMGGYARGFGYTLLSSILERCNSLGLDLVLKQSKNNQKEEESILRSIRRGQLTGLIVQPVTGENYNPLLVSLSLTGFPIVMLDRYLPGIDASYVGTDNYAASYLATKKIIEKKHENIALLSLTDEKTSSVKERIDGFISACSKYHIPVHYDLWQSCLRETESDLEENRRHYAVQIRAHLMSHPQITAIFGTESIIAEAAIEAARSLHLRVPEDLSVVCFDPPEKATNVCNIQQDERKIGIRAVDLLYDLSQGNTEHHFERIPASWHDGSTLTEAKTNSRI